MQSSTLRPKVRSVKGQAEPGDAELVGCSLKELVQLRPTSIVRHFGPFRLLHIPHKGVLPTLSTIARNSRNYLGTTSLETIVELSKARYRGPQVPEITDFFIQSSPLSPREGMT